MQNATSFETKSDGSGKELVGDGMKNSPGKRRVVP